MPSFAASPQARVAIVIAVAYAVSAVALRSSPLQIAAGVLKLTVIVYTVNCLVVGGCGLLSWMHVFALALFLAADMVGLVLSDSALSKQTGGSGIFGPEHSRALSDWHDRVHEPVPAM